MLLACLLLGGVTLVFFGLIGSSSQMEGWCEVTSRHEASIILMVLAFPIYLLLVPFYNRR